ncbi:MAG: ParB/RepB/Spo0J family partition protein [Bacilli bacterium]|nr:ParB/RepB/Spo0J family partition protein [Bacilli bacterium]
MNNKITETDARVLQVPIEDIIPNRFQPRLTFDNKSLEELSNSIKQHGIIQPLVLRRLGDKYEIIAGERRYKAATMAGLASVPAIISELDDNTSAEVAIVENVQRKDLTAIEEAKSFKALLDKGYMTQEELAKKMGLSQAAISNKLRLLALDNVVQDAILQEKISERHARSLLKIKDKEEQKRMLNRIISERLTVRQLEEEIKKMMGNDTDVDVPIVTGIDLNNMVNNAVDIIPAATPGGDTFKLKGLEDDKKEDVKPVAGNDVETAEKMPNKFFNFLEDEAANMSMEDDIASYEKSIIVPEPEEKKTVVQQQSLGNANDDIEMLDDFIIPSVKADTSIEDNSYLGGIINTIRNLHLDSDKVKVEEINLPTEYRINISIQKDKI